ncbi:MAG: DUF7446 family protein [Shewanella sp.]
MKIKHIGASPLTGTIYQGTLDTARGMWVGKKSDITELATRAVAEHLMVTKRGAAYGLKSGGYLLLNAVIVDELPPNMYEEKEEQPPCAAS